MARRKKRKTTHRRRSRMSGTGSGTLKVMAGVAIGAVGGRILYNMASPSLGATVTSIGTVAAGVALPMVIKGSPFVQGIGYGLVASGAVSTLQGMKVIAGGNGVFRVQLPNRVSGTNQLPVVVGAPYNGSSNLSVVNGAPSRMRNPYRR